MDAGFGELTPVRYNNSMIARIRIDETRVAELRDDLQWYSDDPQLERILRTGFSVAQFADDAQWGYIGRCVYAAASSWGVTPELGDSFPAYEDEPDMVY